jgi:hypothetical protein
MPTGGQCKDCFDKFVSIHLKNHIQDLDSRSWLMAYEHRELTQIEMIEKQKTEKYKVVDSPGKNKIGSG